MKELRQQMGEYYATKWPRNREDGTPDWSNFEISRRIEERMDSFVAENSGADPCLIKAELHETITNFFEPVIFSRSPFYYEMGVRLAPNWGTPSLFNVGSWMFRKYNGLFEKQDPEKYGIMRLRAEKGMELQSTTKSPGYSSRLMRNSGS
jgi:hypothetical protein